MVEYYTGVSARLIRGALIPEDFSDNELDEVMNAKTSFNKRVTMGLQNTVDRWHTKDLKLINGNSICCRFTTR
jgi:hypothetical protein